MQKFSIDLKPHQASEQWKKSPCFVNKYVEVELPDGTKGYVKTKKALEVTDPTTQEKKQLKLKEAKDYVDAVLKKAASNITEEEAENVADLAETYTPDVEPVIIEELEAELRKEAELGVGCSGTMPNGEPCIRHFILKPTADGSSYRCVNGLLVKDTLVCDRCGSQITLKDA
jgi:hypothetical protein